MRTLDPSLQTVANASHFCCGWAFVLSVADIGHGLAALMPWLPIALGVAAVKEFVWDILVESPAVSGGWLGGVEDFMGYAGGAAGACLLLLLCGWR